MVILAFVVAASHDFLRRCRCVSFVLRTRVSHYEELRAVARKILVVDFVADLSTLLLGDFVVVRCSDELSVVMVREQVSALGVLRMRQLLWPNFAVVMPICS